MAIVETEYGPSTIESYRDSLQKMFQGYVLPHIAHRQNEELAIASLGCGIGFEMKPLHQLFPNAHILGIDKSFPLIVQATKINNDVPDIKYLVADLTELEKGGGPAWDIAIVRNPQISGSLAAQWEGIISTVGKRIKPEGLVCYTSDYEEDTGKIAQILRETGGLQILLQEPNPHLIRGLSFNDAFITVARRE